MRLSVVMIVKNEEDVLPDCLESVKEADEIIICDTGSEDNTVEVAKKYTDKVFTDYKWEDSFCKARNHALSKATGDWIMTIDADETLEPHGIEKLKNFIENLHPKITRFDIWLKAEKTGNKSKFPRVFKRCPEIKWAGAAHNYLVGGIAAENPMNVTITYGYSPAHKKDPDRTFRILKKHVEENPKAVRERYYLGREYFYRHKWQEAISHFQEHQKRSTYAAELADSYLLMAYCLWYSKEVVRAREACLSAIGINADLKEALLLMSSMSGPQNRDSWLTYAELAQNKSVLFARNRPERGVDFYQKTIKEEPRYEEIRKTVAEWVRDGKILDVGCGVGCLSKYVKNYDGFDIIENPFRKGSAYDPEMYKGQHDYYVFLEVLEHVDDLAVLKNVPSGAKIIFSVPSFLCDGHVRAYSRRSMLLRFFTVLEIGNIVRFNWDAESKKWSTEAPITADSILLCQAEKI